jgi:hypothetical protein
MIYNGLNDFAGIASGETTIFIVFCWKPAAAAIYDKGSPHEWGVPSTPHFAAHETLINRKTANASLSFVAL